MHLAMGAVDDGNIEIRFIESREADPASSILTHYIDLGGVCMISKDVFVQRTSPNPVK